MRITPLDVRKQEFRKAVRGFDCDEVRAFLTTLADEYETVLVDNKQIREHDHGAGGEDRRVPDHGAQPARHPDDRRTRHAGDPGERQQGRRPDHQGRPDEGQAASSRSAACAPRNCAARSMGLRKEKETYLARFKALAEAQIQFVETHRNDFEDLDKRLVDMVDSSWSTTATGPETPGRPPGHADRSRRPGGRTCPGSRPPVRCRRRSGRPGERAGDRGRPRLRPPAETTPRTDAATGLRRRLPVAAPDAAPVRAGSAGRLRSPRDPPTATGSADESAEPPSTEAPCGPRSSRPRPTPAPIQAIAWQMASRNADGRLRMPEDVGRRPMDCRRGIPVTQVRRDGRAWRP